MKDGAMVFVNVSIKVFLRKVFQAKKNKGLWTG